LGTNLAILCVLTFVIHLIGTLAYSVRIAGVIVLVAEKL
jgi:hypothetical protein